MCYAVKNILLVGTNHKRDAILELPVRVFSLDTAAKAIQCLREEMIDVVASSWELCDMSDGQLLMNIKAAKPYIPTIAFVESGNMEQEIAARQVGADAVLSENIDDKQFRNVVCQLLNISNVTSIELAYN